MRCLWIGGVVVGVALATALGVGCSSKAAPAPVVVDGGTCDAIDASIASPVGVPDGGRACAACIEAKCGAAASACASDCTCNAAAVAAIDCLAGLGSGASVSAANACVAPLLSSQATDTTAVPLGQCVATTCAIACDQVSDGGAGGTDAGVHDSGSADGGGFGDATTGDAASDAGSDAGSDGGTDAALADAGGEDGG